MKSKGIIIALFFTAVLFFVGSCGRNADDAASNDNMNNDDMTTMEENQSEQSADNEFWTSDREFTYSERDDFRTEVNTALEKLDTEINNLEIKAADATGDTKEWYNDRVEELRKSRQEITEDFQDFETVTEENWDSFRNTIASAWDDIENSWSQMARDDRMRDDVEQDNINRNY